MQTMHHTQVGGITIFLITLLLIVTCPLAGKDDIFGDSVQEVYMSSVSGQNGARPVISVTDGHGTTMGKSCYAVTAISYCDLHKISLSDLATILDVYPEFTHQFLHNFYITFNLRQVSVAFDVTASVAATNSTLESQFSVQCKSIKLMHLSFTVLVASNVAISELRYS